MHIGNAIRAAGELSFFQNARNPGILTRNSIIRDRTSMGRPGAKEVEVVDDSIWKIRDWLSEFRSQWKKALIQAMGKDGNVLSAMLLGEKSEMDPDTKELYQVRRNRAYPGHLRASPVALSVSGVPESLRRMTGSYTAGGIAGICFWSYTS